MTERRFHAMGCGIRLLVGEPVEGHGTPAAQAAAAAEAWLHDFDRRLSRFRPGSELCALNADPRRTVSASPLLRAAIGAALFAAEQTDGLVDPTLLPQLERAGYRASLGDGRERSGGKPTAFERGSEPRRAARPDPDSRWREIDVDGARGTIARPPGVRLDTGGSGKGLAADALAHLLAGFDRVAIDCAGDVRICGPGAMREPFEIEVAAPFCGPPLHSLAVGGGAVATSGIDSRMWPSPDGGVAHHLLDPSTGRPAWTGVVQATALAPTTLQAETLAKAALLSGPNGARRLLARRGGALVLDDGSTELLGPLATECLEVAA